MPGRLTVFVTALVALDLSVGALGFSLSDKPLSFLISENADKISSLKEVAAAIASDAPEDDVFYLRYALAGADEEEMKSRLEENVRWRSSGEGRLVCDAAKVAIEKATSGDDWNNDPVRAAAPYASVVNDFITEASIVTTSSRAGDLIYCIRAASIDDTALMNAISVENLANFFLYTKEVNAAVANQRSIGSDRLVCVCTANDLSGVKVIGGSAEFRKALSAASRRGNELYPTAERAKSSSQPSSATYSTGQDLYAAVSRRGSKEDQVCAWAAIRRYCAERNIGRKWRRWKQTRQLLDRGGGANLFGLRAAAADLFHVPVGTHD